MLAFVKHGILCSWQGWVTAHTAGVCHFRGNFSPGGTSLEAQGKPWVKKRTRVEVYAALHSSIKSAQCGGGQCVGDLRLRLKGWGSKTITLRTQLDGWDLKFTRPSRQPPTWRVFSRTFRTNQGPRSCEGVLEAVLKSNRRRRSRRRKTQSEWERSRWWRDFFFFALMLQ